MATAAVLMVGAVLSSTSCGGGGGGGGGGGPLPPFAPGGRIAGQVRVPALSFGRDDGGAGAAGALREVEPNDRRWSASDLGLVRRSAQVFVGEVGGGGDPRDAWRFEVAEACRLELLLVDREATDPDRRAGARVGLFAEADGAAAAEGLAVDGRRHTVELVPGSYQLVVAGPGAPLSYRGTLSVLDVAVVHGLRARAVAPALDRPDPLQSDWLGADLEMRVGEIVVYRAGAGASPLPELLRADCARTAAGAGPVEVYRVTPGAVPTTGSGTGVDAVATCRVALRLARLPGVRAASPNYVYRAFAARAGSTSAPDPARAPVPATEPNDPLYGRQWHYPQINLPLAWDLTTGSQDVVVGVLDTGVVLQHPDLRGRLVAGFDMISDPASALDGDGIDADPDDPGDGGGQLPSSFHGTHVAGTVGANTNDGVGVAGVDWACRLMPVRVLGAQGAGSLQDIAQGILYAAGLPNVSGTVPARRCDVLNMSLGGPGASPVLEQACNDAAAAGVVLVAAAGNDDSPNPNSPASFASTISVGSVDFARARAPYSNFHTSIDVWAPGGDTTVDRNGDQQPDGVLSTLADGFGPNRQPTAGFLQGTSMAAPHVAGVVSLMLALDRNLTQARIRDLLRNNAQPGAQLPNGGLLVDAFAVLQAVSGGGGGGGGGTPPTLSATPNAVALDSTVSTATVTVANRGSGNLTFDDTESRIAYDDPGAAGWMQASIDTPASGIDASRLQMQVDRTGLADGDYTATVRLVYRDGGGARFELGVPVSMRVGQRMPANDTVFVILVDADTLETLGQTQTDAGANFAFGFEQVPVGRYLLAAGTDRDNDDVLGDEGELFGIWPTLGAPLVVAVDGPGFDLSGLELSMQEIRNLSAGHGLQLRRTAAR